MPSVLPGSYKPVPFRATVVDFKESEHDIYANTFVAVDKSMIGDQGIANHGSFLFFCEVQVLSIKCLEYSIQGRIGQILIPDSK